VRGLSPSPYLDLTEIRLPDVPETQIFSPMPASAGLPPAQQTAPDPFCVGSPWCNREAPMTRCGIGLELAPALGLLLAVRRRGRAEGGIRPSR